MRTSSKSLIASLLLLITVGAYADSYKAANPVPEARVSPVKAPETRVSVMAYNLENLFDTFDDFDYLENVLAGIDKNDEEYTPVSFKETSQKIIDKCNATPSRYRQKCFKTDWTNEQLKEKMFRLSKAILQKNNGMGPDILVMSEVENIHVLEQLNSDYLRQAGYREPVLIEGPDKRGIDVAILSRFQLVDKPLLSDADLSDNHIRVDEVRYGHNAKLHELKFVEGLYDLPAKEVRPTRGILEASFKLPHNEELTVLAVHFPSQGHPLGSRRQAMDKVNSILASKPASEKVITAGDFNITSLEQRENNFYSEWASQWDISHKVGCGECEGTYYYHRKTQWSFLDVIMFSQNLRSGSMTYDASSVEVPHASTFQVNRFGSPSRFNSGKYPDGVSDHWPIYAELKIAN